MARPFMYSGAPSLKSLQRFYVFFLLSVQTVRFRAMPGCQALKKVVFGSYMDKES